MWSFADVSLLLGKTFSGEQSWLHLSLSLSPSLSIAHHNNDTYDLQ